MTYDAIIIGGGLAGSSAAVELARRGFRTLLLEKRTLPAHRLCGEFLSPEVAGAFARLGVEEKIKAAGAHPIRCARVTTAGGAAFESRLPGTALGLSRYRLDRLLFEQARTAGADARDGMTVRGVTGSLADGFAVKTAGETFAGRIALGAYGKRGLLDRKLGRAFLREHAPFVAFKAHYEGIDLPDLIELHAFPGGYAGLSHVEKGRVNLCWIGHERELKAAGGTPEAMIEHVLAQNRALGARLPVMERVSGFEAISQVSLARKQPFEKDVCMIGDTAGMIAPLCGDGMAMALRSAELAVPLAAAYLSGGCSAEAFRTRYVRAWNRSFTTRLRLGRWMHRAYIRPTVAQAVVRLCRRVPGLGRWLIRHTRG